MRNINIFIISILLGICTFILLSVFFEVNAAADALNFIISIADKISEHIGRSNAKKYAARLKRKNIVNDNNAVITKYNVFVESVIADFGWYLNIESFTSLIIILFFVCIVAFTMLANSIAISFLMTVSVITALFTYLSIHSRILRMRHAEAIAYAEDAICPIAREGVLVAIKKVMETDEYINKSIRPHFLEFIDNCELRGYSFAQAMTILNQRLGSRFDNFAKKAIVFEYNERKGMADIFLDIIDENAAIRNVNLKKEEAFRKMDRDFVLKTVIIAAFFIYALSVEDFRNFMLFTFQGKLINAICLNIICVSFAAGQILQRPLELKHKISKKRKPKSRKPV
ncbi:MAG: hypothetical protein LBM16_04265 [Clostridiales bacterium]|nr:hypothetical protein [Clostridiales bacterium]